MHIQRCILMHERYAVTMSTSRDQRVATSGWTSCAYLLLIIFFTNFSLGFGYSDGTATYALSQPPIAPNCAPTHHMPIAPHATLRSTLLPSNFTSAARLSPNSPDRSSSSFLSLPIYLIPVHHSPFFNLHSFSSSSPLRLSFFVFRLFLFLSTSHLPPPQL